MEGILMLLYYAAHVVAGLADLLCCDLLVFQVYQLGPVAWGLSVVCVALMVLDVLQTYPLDQKWMTVLAGGALPLTCGAVEKLLFQRELLGIQELNIPAVYTFFGLLLLLQLWVLLRGLWAAGEDSLLAGAEDLLERGCALGYAMKGWLGLFAGGVMLCATFGLLLTVIIGALIAEENALWEYIPGMLAGYGLCWLFQVLYLQRGLALAQEEDVWLKTEGWEFALMIPFWNTVQARRLWMQLHSRRVRERQDIEPCCL